MSDHPFADRLSQDLGRFDEATHERLPWPVAVLVIGASAAALWAGVAALLAMLLT